MSGKKSRTIPLKTKKSRNERNTTGKKSPLKRQVKITD